MPEITTGIASIYLFIKAHLPAVFGAVFSGERVPKDNLSVMAWIMTWVATNIFGFALVIVLSVYVGGYIEEYRQLTATQSDVMRLMIGLFGLKLIRYINVKIEPVLNEMVDMMLDKFRRIIGVESDNSDATDIRQESSSNEHRGGGYD